MKINLKEAFLKVFNRFPYTFFLILIEFFGLSLLVELDYFSNHPKEAYIFGTILMGVFCVLMLSLSIQLLSERISMSVKVKVGAFLATTLAVAGLVYLFMYKDIQSYKTIQGAFTGNTYRVLIMMALSAISVFVVPFLKDKDNNQWWNFFITSVSRAAISILYAAVVDFGLSIALFALDLFWDITILDMQFMIVMLFAFVLVAPFHFLRDVYVFDRKGVFVELPKFLSILAKFVLTPLICIYLAILYPYIFSFPFRDKWPANETTIIILVLLSMITAGLVLFYGLGKKSLDIKFAKLYTKVFSLVSIPTILFWAYSLYLRIDAYGMTVNRYALMSLILWFLCMAIYFLFVKETKVKFIISSFVIVFVVVYYLPFSAFFWGQKAQLSRITETFEDNGLVVDGKFVRGEKATSDLAQSVEESFLYLNRYHTLKGIEGKLGSDLEKKFEIDSNGYSKKLGGYVGYSQNLFFDEVEYVNVLPEYLQVRLASKGVGLVDGYTRVEGVDIGNDSETETTFILNEEEFEFALNPNEADLSRDNCENLLEIDKYSYGDETICSSKDSLATIQLEQGLLVIDTVDGRVEDGKFVEIYHIAGYLFTK